MEHFGRISDPTGCSFVNGLCGERMEFYLVIKDDIIEDIKFHTEGCEGTLDCGEMTAVMAEGKNIFEALNLSPKAVIDSIKGLKKEHNHCAILAVSALFRAIADYLLKP